jgi:hypothetical protein
MERRNNLCSEERRKADRVKDMKKGAFKENELLKITSVFWNVAPCSMVESD